MAVGMLDHSAGIAKAAGAEVVLDSLREFPAWYAALRRPAPR